MMLQHPTIQFEGINVTYEGINAAFAAPERWVEMGLEEETWVNEFGHKDEKQDSSLLNIYQTCSSLSYIMHSRNSYNKQTFIKVKHSWS